MAPARAAGKRLGNRVQAALAYASSQRGQDLELDEHDQQRLEQAVRAADDAATLRGLWLEELRGEQRHTRLQSLRAESRLLDQVALRLMGEIIRGINGEPNPARQAASQKALRARWGAPRHESGAS